MRVSASTATSSGSARGSPSAPPDSRTDTKAASAPVTARNAAVAALPISASLTATANRWLSAISASVRAFAACTSTSCTCRWFASRPQTSAATRNMATVTTPLPAAM